MDHPYFKGINFEKLLIKGYKSPFRPKMEVLTLKQKDLLRIRSLSQGLEIQRNNAPVGAN